MIDLNIPLLSQEFPKANFHLFDLFDSQIFSNKTGIFSSFCENDKDVSFYQGDIVGIEFNLDDGLINFYKNSH